MDRRKNPYTPGAGRKPDKLAARDEDLRDFQVLVQRLGDGTYERSVVFSGLWRSWFTLQLSCLGVGNSVQVCCLGLDS
jgi:hypothetical protein